MLHELEFAFSPEALVGWRAWRVARPIDREASALELATGLLAAERRGDPGSVEELFRLRLRSLTEPTFWPPGRRLEASCHAVPQEHEAPSVGCECGVWAFRTSAAVEATVAAYRYCGAPIAFGRVALWGRVIEHELGWRGALAAPLDLFVCGSSEAATSELAAAYGVEASAVVWPQADPEPLVERGRGQVA